MIHPIFRIAQGTEMVQPQLLREARAAGHGLVLRPAAPRQHPLPRGLGTGPGGTTRGPGGSLSEVVFVVGL